MVGLAAQGLCFDYPGPLRAVDGLDLSLAPGELVAVLGPNGSGKTTLLRLLAGLLAPTAGRIALDGRPLDSLGHRARACVVAVMPQHLPPNLDVRVEHFVLGGRYARISRWTGATPDDRKAVAQALADADVADLSTRRMSELSGGQQQRVLVARAVAQQTDVLLVDEPTTALDPEHQVAVFELLARLADRGCATLVVTHDLNLASQFATRLVLMDGGRRVAEGDVESVLRPDVLGPVYGERLHYGRLPDAGGAGGRPFVLPCRGPTGAPVDGPGS